MFRMLKQVRSAVSLLNPDKVRQLANRPLAIGLVASTSAGYADMEDFLLPGQVLGDRKTGLLQNLYRSGDPGAPERFDLILYEQGLACPSNSYTFFREHPERTVADILADHPDLGLPLARMFPEFRKAVVDQTIAAVARENAIFAVASALPNIIPTILELPWALGEFASDTAFLTMNQIRMAFLIAAASDKPLGYGDQKTEIASILAGALGWRAIARELAGKIPLGGGLIPKGAIAYAGTYVIGKGMERFHQLGRVWTRSERRGIYDAAYERGKEVAGEVVRQGQSTGVA
jgi:hypothetical protein